MLGVAVNPTMSDSGKCSYILLKFPTWHSSSINNPTSPSRCSYFFNQGVENLEHVS